MGCPMCNGRGAAGSTYNVTADNVQGGKNVGLSAIARQLGLSDESALTAAEKAAAPSGWAGYLGFAKRIAASNGMVWAGPPSWGTSPTLQVGQVLTIPGGSASAPASGGFLSSIPTWAKVLGAVLLGGIVLGAAKK